MSSGGVLIGEIDRVPRHVRSIAVFLLLATSPLLGQGPTPPSDNPAILFDQIAGLVNRGKLNLEVDLEAGDAAISPVWTLRVIGTPKATLVAEADDGKVGRVEIAITGGELLVLGKGLRPGLSVEGIRFEQGKGISETRFRGRGMWRPVVAVFRALARPALRKLDVPTDIRSILRGEILSSKKSPDASDAAFLDLVREVHIDRSELVAFAGHPLGLNPIVQLQTAAHPTTGLPLRVTIDKGVFRPARREKPAQFDMDGRLDGEIENGAVDFVGSRCAFSRGELESGVFRVFSGKDGQVETSFSAGALALDLTSGQFRWPGGPNVAVEAPSHFVVRDLSVRSDGGYSGKVDAALYGKVGTIDRAGTSVAASDVELRIAGATIVDGRATGDAKIDFQYHFDHTLVVHYPVEELGDRRVPLLFEGPFAAELHFESAGNGDEGAVAGTYRFDIPWGPIEKAAFEVLRARWSQDIAPAIHKVDFAVEPRRFGPCGRDCFLLDLVITAQKAKKTNGFLFQQICDAQGKADLVVDTPSRSLVLRNVRVEPRCHGVVGAVVNVVAPFLAKTYSDVTLLRMPDNLPFTIDSVGSGPDSIFIAGKVVWAMKPAEVGGAGER